MQKIKNAVFDVQREAQGIEEYFEPLTGLSNHTLENLTGTLPELMKAQAILEMRKKNGIALWANNEAFERFKTLILAHEEAPQNKTEENNENTNNKSGG